MSNHVFWEKMSSICLLLLQVLYINLFKAEVEWYRPGSGTVDKHASFGLRYSYNAFRYILVDPHDHDWFLNDIPYLILTVFLLMCCFCYIVVCSTNASEKLFRYCAHFWVTFFIIIQIHIKSSYFVLNRFSNLYKLEQLEPRAYRQVYLFSPSRLSYLIVSDRFIS